MLPKLWQRKKRQIIREQYWMGRYKTCLIEILELKKRDIMLEDNAWEFYGRKEKHKYTDTGNTMHTKQGKYEEIQNYTL